MYELAMLIISKGLVSFCLRQSFVKTQIKILLDLRDPVAVTKMCMFLCVARPAVYFAGC